MKLTIISMIGILCALYLTWQNSIHALVQALAR